MKRQQGDVSEPRNGALGQRLILGAIGGALLGGIYLLVSIPATITDSTSTNVAIALVLTLMPPLAVLLPRHTTEVF